MQALILALKAIPAVKSLIEKFFDEWMKYQDDLDSQRTANKEIQRQAILKSLTHQGLTNEERSALRRSLYNLNKL